MIKIKFEWETSWQSIKWTYFSLTLFCVCANKKKMCIIASSTTFFPLCCEKIVKIFFLHLDNNCNFNFKTKYYTQINISIFILFTCQQSINCNIYVHYSESSILIKRCCLEVCFWCKIKPIIALSMAIERVIIFDQYRVYLQQYESIPMPNTNQRQLITEYKSLNK